MIKILYITMILFCVAMAISIGDIIPTEPNLDYTGTTTEIEFLGGGLGDTTKTLVRFDNGDTLLFKDHKTEIPLNKEVKFYYGYNTFYGMFVLDNFEVIRRDD